MDIGKTLFMILQNMKKFVMKNLSGELTFLGFKCLKIAYYKSPVTQKEIIEETGLSKGTVSKALRRLEKKRLITRRRVGRKYQIELTDEGMAVMKKFEKIASEINKILLKDFSEEEMKNLKNLLERMLKNIEQVVK
ncbi:MarR family winged helix-turn-helix transcriptional regulator [Archaeoglobus profundus]|uniref:Transcriptional regulator, TrmB n=1 Tax=Archaeoglobus profundus (strain DSM 5631 / JCM 9629 / NBRC 100127 / Av18) TaxID=572546 RepID=D2RHF8_ARCPA|nr:MarR family transcriptional regulator [Archaeoglobus profundus]ADB57733.1 transcriptional regulator, TrmB [Archaeoglobus profundus DSM 5631]